MRVSSLLNVYISRFAENLLLDTLRETHAPMETENPHSSQHGEASMNNPLESVVLSPDIQHEKLYQFSEWS